MGKDILVGPFMPRGKLKRVLKKGKHFIRVKLINIKNAFTPQRITLPFEIEKGASGEMHSVVLHKIVPINEVYYPDQISEQSPPNLAIPIFEVVDHSRNAHIYGPDDEVPIPPTYQCNFGRQQTVPMRSTGTGDSYPFFNLHRERE
jgi:hypothetical protein